jgi:Ca2+-binding EF-hand superfamily protein
LIRALGFPIKKGEVVRLVHDVDPSNEGFVTVSQLIDVMAILYSNRHPETEVTEAFKLFDDDGTGQITLNNMRRVARELGETLTDKELQVSGHSAAAWCSTAYSFAVTYWCLD